MRYVTMAVMLAFCVVFQGCVHHHTRPHNTYDEPRVVHHVVTPAPPARHDISPHHPAPKPHVVHARPAHKPQAHHNGHNAPKVHKPEPRQHSGNNRHDNRHDDRHVSQPHHRN